MISKVDIEKNVDAQTAKIRGTSSFPRALLPEVKAVDGYATIVTGIRRSGKSTLVGQLLRKCRNHLYLNFDTPSLYGFRMEDFALLDAVIKERKARNLFFDEIQVVKGWEVYVRGKLDEGYKVVITGSNASLLSRELGTHLTGRHISKTLYPFSYAEFCGLKRKVLGERSFHEYLQLGGFPQYLKFMDEEILQNLVNDIVYRDIMVRYGLKEDLPLKKLLLYLIGNIGNPVSATSLKNVIGVKAPQTILDYFSYLENSYVVQFVPKFSYSFKVQQVNPKKVYCVDMGLHSAMSPSFSKDLGRKLENTVFLELVRNKFDVFYLNENGHECDFIACQNNEPKVAIQVCYDFTVENREREVAGLAEALKFFKMESGLLLTLNQTDEINVEGKRVHVMPVWKWMESHVRSRV